MKNVLIGLFMMVACGLVVAIVLFLEPSVGDGKATLIVRFSNINGLSLGTRVMFAGKPVGEVVAIEQIKEAREQLTNDLGQVYFYQLILKIDSSVRIYNTDEIAVQTLGLLGEKSIAIIPRSAPKGIEPTLVTPGLPLYADSVDPLESAFHEFVNLSDKIGETLEKVMSWVDQNGQDLGFAVRSFSDAMEAAAITLSGVNQSQLLEEIRSGAQMFFQTMRAAEGILTQMDQEGVFRELGITIKNAKSASSVLERLMSSIARQEGSAGKLLLGEQTYLEVTALLSKLDTMMNDVNHYGLLFHLNKKWQRTRLKRANLLTALKTPQDFQAYFNREVDLINTSMSRLSMLIDSVREKGDEGGLLDTDGFRKKFLELMRRSQALCETLKLYNEQLVENQPLCD